jgi:c-di-GMP-binding flagellar brake protein YcgR
METDPDRRGASRKKMDKLIHIEFGSDEFLVAEGLNISRGGILCKAAHPIRKNEPIHVMLCLGPEDQDAFSKELDGKVVHCREGEGNAYMLGLQFSRVEGDVQLELQHYLEQL